MKIEHSTNMNLIFFIFVQEIEK